MGKRYAMSPADYVQLDIYGRTPKVRKEKNMRAQTCPVCGATIKRLPAADVVRGRFQTEGEYYWTCKNFPSCDTYIKEDPKTGNPAGTLAWRALRWKRILLHQWESIFIEAKVKTKDEFWDIVDVAIYGPGRRKMVHASTMTEHECDMALQYIAMLVKPHPEIMNYIRKGSALDRYLQGNTTGRIETATA